MLGNLLEAALFTGISLECSPGSPAIFDKMATSCPPYLSPYYE